MTKTEMKDKHNGLSLDGSGINKTNERTELKLKIIKFCQKYIQGFGLGPIASQ